MTDVKLKIKRLDRNGKKPPLPYYASSGAAGLDLAYFGEEDVTLKHGEIKKICTGICVEIPQDHVGLIYIRSSLGAKHGITLANSVGVIDCDYRGELMVFATNASDTPYTIKPGDRFAQLVITPAPKFPIEECEALSDTDRGTGGFGSTNK